MPTTYADVPIVSKANVQRMVADMQREEISATIAETAHHRRRQVKRPQDRVVILLEDYSEKMCSYLCGSFTLTIDSGGRPNISNLKPPDTGDCSFNTERLRSEAINIAWPDHELSDMLKTGA